MPRTREFNPESVLDVALDLFWRKGYKACAMADVVKDSGVARYGLYQAFKDKDQLFYATLKRYRQKLHEVFFQPYCVDDGGYELLEQHFDQIVEQLDKGDHEGCYAHQAAIERGSKDPKVCEIVNAIFDDAKKMYRTLLTNAVERGEVRNMPMDDLVIYVLGIQRALIAMAKQRCSSEERKKYAKCALKLLKTPPLQH